MPLTDEQRRDIATGLMQDHAIGVEHLSIAEHCADEELDATDEDLNDIGELIRSADIAVTWPDSRPDVFEVCSWIAALGTDMATWDGVTVDQIITRARQALGQLDEEN